MLDQSGDSGATGHVHHVDVASHLLERPNHLSVICFNTLVVVIANLLLLPVSASSVVFAGFPITFFATISTLSAYNVPIIGANRC